MKYFYDHGIFTVKGNDLVSVLENEPSHDYIIQNIGRTKISATARYGSNKLWHGKEEDKSIKPGELVKMAVTQNATFDLSDLRIENPTNDMAVFSAHVKDGKPNYERDFSYDFTLFEVTRDIAMFDFKLLQHLYKDLEGFVNKFWPLYASNVWEVLRDILKNLVDEDEVRETIDSVLSTKIKEIEKEMRVLVEQMNKKDAGVTDTYMKIVDMIFHVEQSFIVTQKYLNTKHANFVLLPLYSHSVHMQMVYFTIGLNLAKEIKLSNAHLEKIKKHREELFKGAYEHFTTLKKEQEEVAYTYDPRGIYNKIIEYRTYVGVHGLEFMPVWKQMMEEPSKEAKAHNNVITYSPFYGRQTGQLVKEGLYAKLEEPLKPTMANGKRNEMTKVKVYVNPENQRVSGMVVEFQNGKSKEMGDRSGKVHEIPFNNKRLVKLTAWGYGLVDRLEFEFSDGKTVAVGTLDSVENHVFHMPKHHIASIVLSNDYPYSGVQADNIAVSYLLTVD